MSPDRPSTNRPNRPKQRQALTGRNRRSSATTWTWGAIVVVVAAVLVIVLIDTMTSSAKQQSAFGAPTQTELNEVTQIPSTVFDTVGITSPAVQVGGFARVLKQEPLTFPSGSKTLPGFLYYGAEYCPYCAATRWAIVAALSRFGTFTNLQLMKSSATDVDPNTNTFTFRYATYKSKYFVFKSLEAYDRNRHLIRGNQQPDSFTGPIIQHYDPQGSFPFLDIGNKVFLVGSPYDPQVLAGESWSQIAAGLSDPTNYATQAIIATTNYITAGLCEITGNAPASVCTSSGVQVAMTKLNKPAH